MNSADTIIDQETIDYIIIALGACNDNIRKKHMGWSFNIDNKSIPVFPKNDVDDMNKIDAYLQNIFEGRTLNDVYAIMIKSGIEYSFRSSIMSHLSLLISNAKMSQEIVEIKNSVKDLNDKFAILMDVLELNKPK